MPAFVPPKALTDALRRMVSTDAKDAPELLSAEGGADLAAGFIPGVGQAQAIRDFQRASQVGDRTGAALSLLGLVPGAHLAKALRKAPIAEMVGKRFPGGDTKLAHSRELGGEISDAGAAIKRDPLQAGETEYLEDVVNHPELFEAYPELKTLKVWADSKLVGNRGYFNHNRSGTNTFIGLRPNLDRMKDLLMHEVQHAIQKLDGRMPFDETLSEKSARGYAITPYEKEARLTQMRASLKTKELKKFPRNEDMVEQARILRGTPMGVTPVLYPEGIARTASAKARERARLAAAKKSALITKGYHLSEQEQEMLDQFGPTSKEQAALEDALEQRISDRHARR